MMTIGKLIEGMMMMMMMMMMMIDDVDDVDDDDDVTHICSNHLLSQHTP